MTLRDILHFPNPNLRKVAAPVEAVDDDIRQLVDDLFETMYEANGVGLAATQIDEHLQVIVVDTSPDRREAYVLINPIIVKKSGEQICEEGCLSVPGIFERVKRHQKITVQALNRSGEPFELEAEDFLADCVQHEMDHLKGVLFVDYLSNLKRQRTLKKIKQMQYAVL